MSSLMSERKAIQVLLEVNQLPPFKKKSPRKAGAIIALARVSVKERNLKKGKRSPLYVVKIWS